jgi:hypothetical protein
LFSYLYRKPAYFLVFLRFNRFACVAYFNPIEPNSEVNGHHGHQANRSPKSPKLCCRQTPTQSSCPCPVNELSQSEFRSVQVLSARPKPTLFAVPFLFPLWKLKRGPLRISVLWLLSIMIDEHERAGIRLRFCEPITPGPEEAAKSHSMTNAVLIEHRSRRGRGKEHGLVEQRIKPDEESSQAPAESGTREC